MSRFNQTTSPTKTTNLAGGEAYIQSPELELISILLTSFAQDQFYRSANDTFDRLKQVILACDKEFVAKAAVYARTVFGMRSITHVVASELAKHISGKEWAKSFYDKIIYRPDDMMEILSYHTANNGKIPNSIKKGFATAIGRFSPYSLGKYRGEGKGFKLVDVVNMVHPVSTEKNGDAIKALVSGELKAVDTWESDLSAAGQNASNEADKAELKKQVWIKLIKENKLPYFATLRNLRNIIEQAPEIVDEACAALVNEAAIKKSLVLPFRFLTAFEEIQKLSPSSAVKKVIMALNQTTDISLNNVPKFDGETLVVLDVSGSMQMGHMGMKSPHIIGSLFSSVLIKACNADFMVFADNAKYINVNPMDSTITIANSLRFSSGGTNFHSIFQTANKKYDRVVILSDSQGWIGGNVPSASYTQYKQKFSANPFLYSFDLQGYGSMQFPEQNTFCLSGFSDKVFDLFKFLETDKKALINTIKAVEL